MGLMGAFLEVPLFGGLIAHLRFDRQFGFPKGSRDSLCIAADPNQGTMGA